MLGTLGSFWAEGWASFAFLLRFSPDDFEDWAEDDAGTDWPAGRSFAPLSGLDGFEDEHRL